MATAQIIWREPESFVSGDTLLFQRNLPTFPPSDGWAIKLVVTQNLPSGAKKVSESVSSADSTGAYHVFNVPDFCAGLDAGNYILTEEVVNAAGNAGLGISAGEKHQIYFSDEFELQDNLSVGNATAVVKTDTQIILEGLYDTYKNLLKLKFSETEDLRSRFRIQDQSKVLEDIKYWKSVRILEVQKERARNGRNPSNVQEAVFCIG
jgi:hypothetical protein